MKKLLYVCEADSGGIMEYAIRQSAAIAQEDVEVHFLCKPSFPAERLAVGIVLEKFARENPPRWAVWKFGTVWRLTFGQRRNAKQVAKLADQLAQPSSTRHQLPATRHNLGAAEVSVLFACYKEYFAPFWVGPLRRLARRGVVIGTIAHDPVRDFVVGPLWWHRWSMRLGYSFARHVFVHDDTPVDFGGKRPEGIQVHQIPHGPYEVAEPKIGREAMRKKLGFDSVLTTEDTETTEQEDKDLSHGGTANTEKLGKEAGLRPGSRAGAAFSNPSTSELARDSENTSLNRSTIAPASDAALDSRPSTLDCKAPATSNPLPVTPASPDVVFLAFGQIRDGKNLDLFLRAMTQLPENVKLLVAGKGDSGSSRPAAFYQKLAEELGVAARCRWDIRRIPEDEVGDIFAACDLVLLSYSARFRSASGVLNAAVSARKLVLASSGLGPLKTVVNNYHLGVFVEPDDVEEIVRGASKFVPNSAMEQPATPAPAWDRYECENSWEESARIVLENLEIE